MYPLLLQEAHVGRHRRRRSGRSGSGRRDYDNALYNWTVGDDGSDSTCGIVSGFGTGTSAEILVPAKDAESDMEISSKEFKNRERRLT